MKRRILAGILLMLASLIGAGCGGISANGSASPATFLLPGIGQATPAPQPALPEAPLVATRH